MESPKHLAIFENLLLKQCILDIFQLKFSLKIGNNISIGGGSSPLGPLAMPLTQNIASSVHFRKIRDLFEGQDFFPPITTI